MSTLEASSIIPRIEAALKTTRQPRKGCPYSPEELAILKKHKAEYRTKTTHTERVQMLKNKLFVDIFNFWDAKGIPLDEAEMRKRMKVFIIAGYLNYPSNSNSPS
jgi:hypothetical protein